MEKRTDSELSNDTLGIPESRETGEELPNGCHLCGGSCALTETVLFFRIGADHYGVAHVECARRRVAP